MPPEGRPLTRLYGEELHVKVNRMMIATMAGLASVAVMVPATAQTDSSDPGSERKIVRQRTHEPPDPGPEPPRTIESQVSTSVNGQRAQFAQSLAHQSRPAGFALRNSQDETRGPDSVGVLEYEPSGRGLTRVIVHHLDESDRIAIADVTGSPDDEDRIYEQWDDGTEALVNDLNSDTYTQILLVKNGTMVNLVSTLDGSGLPPVEIDVLRRWAQDITREM